MISIQKHIPHAVFRGFSAALTLAFCAFIPAVSRAQGTGPLGGILSDICTHIYAFNVPNQYIATYTQPDSLPQNWPGDWHKHVLVDLGEYNPVWDTRWPVEMKNMGGGKWEIYVVSMPVDAQDFLFGVLYPLRVYIGPEPHQELHWVPHGFVPNVDDGAVFYYRPPFFDIIQDGNPAGVFKHSQEDCEIGTYTHNATPAPPNDKLGVPNPDNEVSDGDPVEIHLIGTGIILEGRIVVTGSGSSTVNHIVIDEIPYDVPAGKYDIKVTIFGVDPLINELALSSSVFASGSITIVMDPSNVDIEEGVVLDGETKVGKYRPGGSYKHLDNDDLDVDIVIIEPNGNKRYFKGKVGPDGDIILVKEVDENGDDLDGDPDPLEGEDLKICITISKDDEKIVNKKGRIDLFTIKPNLVITHIEVKVEGVGNTNITIKVSGCENYNLSYGLFGHHEEISKNITDKTKAINPAVAVGYAHKPATTKAGRFDENGVITFTFKKPKAERYFFHARVVEL